VVLPDLGEQALGAVDRVDGRKPLLKFEEFTSRFLGVSLGQDLAFFVRLAETAVLFEDIGQRVVFVRFAAGALSVAACQNLQFHILFGRG